MQNSRAWISGMKCIPINAHSHKPWEGPYELVQTNGITAGNDFGYGYSTVRIANNFIINVDKCDISEGLKERMKQKPVSSVPGSIYN